MNVRRTAVIAVALATLASLTFSGGPAGAGLPECPVFDPNAAADGQVAAQGQSFIGQGIFNTNGDNQTHFFNLGPGNRKFKYFEYINTDDITRDVVVQAKILGDVDAFTVKANRLGSSKDITAKLFRAEGRKFRSIPADQSTGQIEVKIRLKAGASPDSSITVRFRGAFDEASRCGDTVKARANANPL